MSRRERIEFLLDHWNDYSQPASSNGLVAVSGGGLGVPTLTPMRRHPSVVELVRCVDLLRGVAKNHAAHMLAYYGAEWRIVWIPVVTGNGKRVLEHDGSPKRRPERRRATPAWVVLRMVERGVDFVVFAFAVEPFIPDELLEGIAA